MFDDFRSERKRVITALRRRIRSTQYRLILTELEKWLEQVPMPTGDQAETPIAEVVHTEITRHYKVVRKSGNAIDEGTADEEVHALRIECKKLRYLLELFSSLIEPSQLKCIVNGLKGLQTVLGDFNDYAVQIDSMNEHLAKVEELDRHSAAAVGGLITILQHQKDAARALVAERFAEFSKRKMRRKFVSMLCSIRKTSS